MPFLVAGGDASLRVSFRSRTYGWGKVKGSNDKFNPIKRHNKQHPPQLQQLTITTDAAAAPAPAATFQELLAQFDAAPVNSPQRLVARRDYEVNPDYEVRKEGTACWGLVHLVVLRMAGLVGMALLYYGFFCLHCGLATLPALAQACPLPGSWHLSSWALIWEA